MDVEKAALVVCLTLFIVVGINAALYVGLTRKTTIGQIELLRRAAQRAKDPWGQENADLEELARRVEELKGSPPKEPDDR